MTSIYYIFLVTFLVFPIIGIILSKQIVLNRFLKIRAPVVAFFLTHNILFIFGYSLKGDYIDYFIFSIEYLVFCLTISLLFKANNIFAKIVRIAGTIAISLGFIVGLIGILLFIFIAQDYETDKVFHFTSKGKKFETRRYSFGGATLSDTRYTFETYRNYKYFPLERKIDKTDFFDTKTNLNIDEDELKISINRVDTKEQIIFQSTNGHTFSKSLD
jgi:hypothetical protein